MSKETRTALLLCGDWQQSVELGDWSIDDAVDLHIEPGLCNRPWRIGELLADRGISRLVLGFCSDEYPTAEVQTQARKVGLDALGVEVVHLGNVGPEKAKLLLTAAVERARAFRGSKLENAKLYVSPKVSRRSLLRLSISEYRSVPSIDHGLCVAGIGCRMCVEVCPHNALEWSGGTIHHDKSECEPCGLCITACPCGAIVDPACTSEQLEAQIRTLLSEDFPGHRGIVFLCQQSPDLEMASDWMPVRLPSVGMASPAWLLAPLLMGASSVGVVKCQKGCLACGVGVLEENVAFCQEFLQMIEAPADLVRLNPNLSRNPGVERRPVTLESPFSHESGAAILTKLASEYGRNQGFLQHPRSPVGLIKIRIEACTACAMCAKSCPTEALAYGEEDEGVTLTFDARLCVGCGLCLTKCPEIKARAISLVKAVDLQCLRQGRTAVYREEMAKCQRCGAPIAPQSMMRRVEELLGDRYARVIPMLNRYCIDCRVLSQNE